MKRRIMITLFFVTVLLLMVSCNSDKTKEKDVVRVDGYGDNNGFNINYLCGVDQFDRAFMPVTGIDDKKDVGMFYFLWHGLSGKTTYNNTQLLKDKPDDFWNTKGTKNSPLNSFHYWGEPLFGYYRSNDKWVIAKHVEMLTAAGVDFLVFDTTNSFAYINESKAVLSVLDEYQKAGWNVPKVAYYTNSYSIRTMEQIYAEIYKYKEYSGLWYCPDGTHPLIIGALTPEQDKSIINDKSYNPKPLSEEFLSFFDLRSTQWPFDPVKEDGFPWMEWTYPQPNHNGIMNVSLAQHPQLPFSDSITDRSKNKGRGYNYVTKKNEGENSHKGINAQAQWDTVHNNKGNVHTVFVTGWNEWIAQKLVLDNRVWFVDCANEEFSRDIEPNADGYEDAFYVQLADNIRRFKGLEGVLKPGMEATIDVNKDASQWDSVTNIYKALSQTVRERDSRSVDNKIKYEQEPARNNIQEIKLTNDKNNVYFMIKCDKDIVTDYTNNNWMNIFIGIGDVKLRDWESYSFVVNQKVEGNKGSICSLLSDGKATEVGKADISVKGNVLQVSIPMSSLGIKDNIKGIYFKVADEVENPTDIMSYYTTGKSLPMGRLSYYYYMN